MYTLAGFDLTTNNSASGDNVPSDNADTNREGCQMAYFQTKNPNLAKFWRVLQWKMLVNYMAIWSIVRLLGIFCGHLVYFMVIWYIFPRFGMLYQEKSGNTAYRRGNIPTVVRPCRPTDRRILPTVGSGRIDPERRRISFRSAFRPARFSGKRQPSEKSGAPWSLAQRRCSSIHQKSHPRNFPRELFSPLDESSSF
jgi:hypothetical protein